MRVAGILLLQQLSAACAFHSSAYRIKPLSVSRPSFVQMGVQVKTLVAAPPGAPKPKAGDIVVAHYTGWLKTSVGKGKQFDTSRGWLNLKRPFKFAGS